MTAHISEDQLILHYYGENPAVEIDSHLSACEHCRAAYADLQRLLNTMDAAAVPERGPDYGAQVWTRLTKQWQPPRQSWWLRPPKWAWAAVMAVLVVGSFLAGRYSLQSKPAPVVASTRPNRVLLNALGDHLDRSQMLLVELSNAPAGNPADQESAERLLEANRLYRVLAASAGETAVAELLDQMEILLTGVAHGDSPLDPGSAEGILFKVRIVGSEVKEREERMQKGISTL